MSTTIQNVLGNRNLLGLVDAILPGLPTGHLPPGLLSSAVKRGIMGNTGTYLKQDGPQKTARHTNYGGASRLRTVSGLAEQPVVLLSPKESIDIKAHSLINLLSPDGAVQKLGEAEVARQVRECITLTQNFRVGAITAMFGLNGHIYLDGDGNLLPLFHGTYSDFKKFGKGDLGYHFGTHEAANARIGKAIEDDDPRVRGQYLRGREGVHNDLRSVGFGPHARTMKRSRLGHVSNR